MALRDKAGSISLDRNTLVQAEADLTVTPVNDAPELTGDKGLFWPTAKKMWPTPSTSVTCCWGCSDVDGEALSVQNVKLGDPIRWIAGISAPGTIDMVPSNDQ